MSPYSRKKQTIREKRQAILHWMLGTTCRILLCVITALVGILYVLQVNSISVKGYEISDLQKKIALLEQDRERLDVEIAQYRSMGSIHERVKSLDMVAVGNVTYITPVGTAVALR